MKKKLILVGASAFAEVAYEYFTHDSEFEVVAFALESAYRNQEQFMGLPLVDLETVEHHFSPQTHYVYVSVVYTQINRLRARLMNLVKAKGYRLASYVSSRAFVWRNVVLGEHCFIFEDNTLQPFVKIGNNVVLWSGNHIGHHSSIGDHCFISSHVVISGFCEIGAYSFLGVNATFANNLSVGCSNWIGPNTAIMKSTADNAFYKTKQAVPEERTSLDFFKITETL
jgi:sugar O-acyltransferase (sialic acid O-acetyltransferase NeuD family)